MSERICYPLVQVPERYIGTVTAPEGGLKPGDVVIANEIDSGIWHNFTQYKATTPTTSLMGIESLAIVIQGGCFETTEDGRMPIGNPDYAQYSYEAGKTAPVLFLEPRYNFLFVR